MADLQRPSLVERDIEQAISALKKGSQLLKYGRRGKPKFCPFRLSADESALIWYYGKDEKKLELHQVSRIIPGQRTSVFQRYPRPEKEYQSFSLIYNDRSLDMICKDKDEAEVWFVGLKALISRCGYRRLRDESKKENSVSDGVPLWSSASSPSSSDQSVVTQRRFGKSFAEILSYTAKSPLPVDSVSFSPIPKRNEAAENGNVQASGSETLRLSLSSACSSSQGSCTDDVDSLGDVFLWGEGAGDGLIGGGIGKLNGPSTDALLPKPLECTLVLDVRYISCGKKHAVLVSKQGDIFSWGEESGGRLGHGVEEDAAHPKAIEALSGKIIEMVACGEYHTCAVTIDGDMYTWGDGCLNCGVLGHGNETSHWIPKIIVNPIDGLQVSFISCGPWHTSILTLEGQLFTFGDGTFGALGHGDHSSSHIPREVETLKGLRTVRVACGVWHTAAVVNISCESSEHDQAEQTATGKLFTWGDGDKGRLGHGDNESKLVPHCIASAADVNFVKVACGNNVTIALASSGRVYSMGDNDHGQLGVPLADGKTPVCIGGNLTDKFVEDIACGSFHVVSLTSKGEIFTWGKGRNGQLGHGDKDDRSTPTMVDFLKDRQVKSIACGSNFTASICAHKWTSNVDNSLCTGCHNPFTFIRQRHNCYNCGLAFCNSCSTKKALKASLAPSPKKPYRVCDDCFMKLKKAANSSSIWGIRKVKSGGVLSKSTDEKEGGVSSLMGQFSRLSHSESFKSEKCVGSNVRFESIDSGLFSLQNGNIQRLSTSSRSPISPRNHKNLIAVSVPSSRLVSRSPSPVQGNSRYIWSASMSPLFSFRTSDDASDDRKSCRDSLYDEIRSLRSQVEELTKRSQLLEAELNRKQIQINEANARAVDEAGKNEAAKEVIKELMSQLKDMTERAPADKQASPPSESHENTINDTMYPRTSGSSDGLISPSSRRRATSNGQVQKSERIIQDDPGCISHSPHCPMDAMN